MSISLATLAPQKRQVTISQGDIDVYGLTLEEIIAFIGRFPDVLDVITETEETTDRQIIGTLIGQSPKIVAALIALVVHQPEAEEGARTLPPGDQLDIIKAAIELTMPRGFGPFVEMLRGLGLTSRSSPGAPASPSLMTRSAPGPNGRDGDMSLSLDTTSS